MQTIQDVHRQFAGFFNNEALAPYIWLLSKRMQEGHICIHQNDLTPFVPELPYKPPFHPDTLKNQHSFIGTKPEAIKPFILHKERLYLHRYFQYETQILKSIGQLLEQEASVLASRMEACMRIRPVLEALKSEVPKGDVPSHEKIDWQTTGALLGALHNFTIITGGPGTGKTTTVAKLLAILYSIEPNCKVALAAPTGKAAMRMAESLKQAKLPLDQKIKEKFSSLNPNTIHRLLKYKPDSVTFKHNRLNPLPYDVVIVDEASMIDTALLSKLLEALHTNSRIILLGDKNQLASVEAGSMFGDLCKSIENGNRLESKTCSFINNLIPNPEQQITDDFIEAKKHPLSEHITELVRSHRFTSTGGIGKFSKAILLNDEQELKKMIVSNEDPTVLIDTQSDQKLFDSFIDGYRDYILEPDIAQALEKMNKLKVLCAVREGEQGLYTLNRKIEQYLQKQKLLQTDTEFYENRPVLVTRNYPDLKLFNGDIGIVRKDSKGSIRVWFEDSEKEIRSVMPGYLTDAETVFAMTIHKSQGSEYPNVLVVLPHNTGNALLTRELLYTAVTRSKSRVLVQAPEAILFETTKGTVRRASGINYRFDEI
jgi:exodeoxyribonuclease V alpha subunit